MPKLRVLSAKDLVRFFERLGFVIDRQKGSHVTMKRIVNHAEQPLLIPNHREIPKGTIKAIYNQANVFVAKQDLDEFFYTK